MITEFNCSIHAIKTDREGETTLSLKIPKSDLGHVVSLHGALETALTVTVNPLNSL